MMAATASITTATASVRRNSVLAVLAPTATEDTVVPLV